MELGRLAERRGASQSKATPQHEPPASPLWFLIVVVCGAANAACSARVQCSATDTVEEVRLRCERATGNRCSKYLLVEQTRKPMRDHLLVRDYGLNGSQRVRLVTEDDDWFGLRGGAGAAAEADVDALLSLLGAVKGLDKLDGWSGWFSKLARHRDASKCEGVTVGAGGRVIKLDFYGKGLSGAFRVRTPPPTIPHIPASPVSAFRAGVLPREIGQLTALVSFDCRSNQFTGTVYSRTRTTVRGGGVYRAHQVRPRCTVSGLLYAPYYKPLCSFFSKLT